MMNALQAIVLCHSKHALCHWKIRKYATMVDLYCSFTVIGRLPRTHMLVVMVESSQKKFGNINMSCKYMGKTYFEGK